MQKAQPVGLRWLTAPRADGGTLLTARFDMHLETTTQGRWTLLLLLGGLAFACGHRKALTDGGTGDITDAGAKDVAAELDAGLDDAAGGDLAADTSNADATYAVDGVCPIQGASLVGNVCRCQGDLPDSCPNPGFAGDAGLSESNHPLVCVDTRSDPDHCGACGSKCAPTSACRDGACTVAPTVFVAPFSKCFGLQLAAGGGFLFWADFGQGTIMRAPATGGAATMFASAQGGITEIRVFGDAVYWITGGAAALMKAPIAGGPPVLVATSPNAGGPLRTFTGINGFTVAPDGTVYFSSANQIYTVAPGGGAPALVVDVTNYIPFGLALDGGTLVFATDGYPFAAMLNSGQVAACGMPLGETYACEIAKTHNTHSNPIFARNGRATWAANGYAGTLLSASTAPVPGLAVADWDDIGISDGAPTQAFWIRDDVAFVATAPAQSRLGGTISEAPLVPDSRARPLARHWGPGPPDRSWEVMSLVTDEARIFWATYERGNIDADSWCAIESLTR